MISHEVWRLKIKRLRAQLERRYGFVDREVRLVEFMCFSATMG